MAIGIYFAPRAMTSDRYDQCIKALPAPRAAAPARKKARPGARKKR